MTKNVGSADKIIRLIAGVVLISVPFVSGFAVFKRTAATIASVVVGAVLIGTALLNFCSPYRLVGMSTCRVGARHD